MKDFAAGTIPGPDGSPIGSRGGLRRTFGTCGVVGKLSKLTNSAFSRGETRIRLTLKEGVIRDLRRGPALGGREARGTGILARGKCPWAATLGGREARGTGILARGRCPWAATRGGGRHAARAPQLTCTIAKRKEAGTDTLAL